MNELIFPSDQIRYSVENQQNITNIDYETIKHNPSVGGIFPNLQNINCVLYCFGEYQPRFWDCIEKSPEHCKTKVETHWKGKHCKPFYQTGRW